MTGRATDAGALANLLAAAHVPGKVQLIGLTGHRSPNSITACRRRIRDVGLM